MSSSSSSLPSALLSPSERSAHILDPTSNSSDSDEVLCLSQKNLTAVPAYVMRMVHLKRLKLDHNILTSLPADFVGLVHLRYLNLRSNGFTIFPLTIFELPSLEALDLSKNKIEDIPDRPDCLKKLRILSLSDNVLRKLPRFFGGLDRLERLMIAHNPVVWPPPEVLEGSSDDAAWLNRVKQFLNSSKDNAGQGSAASHPAHTSVPAVVRAPESPRTFNRDSINVPPSPSISAPRGGGGPLSMVRVSSAGSSSIHSVSVPMTKTPSSGALSQTSVRHGRKPSESISGARECDALCDIYFRTSSETPIDAHGLGSEWDIGLLEISRTMAFASAQLYRTIRNLVVGTVDREASIKDFEKELKDMNRRTVRLLSLLTSITTPPADDTQRISTRDVWRTLMIRVKEFTLEAALGSKRLVLAVQDALPTLLSSVDGRLARAFMLSWQGVITEVIDAVESTARLRVIAHDAGPSPLAAAATISSTISDSTLTTERGPRSSQLRTSLQRTFPTELSLAEASTLPSGCDEELFAFTEISINAVINALDLLRGLPVQLKESLEPQRVSDEPDSKLLLASTESPQVAGPPGGFVQSSVQALQLSSLMQQLDTANHRLSSAYEALAKTPSSVSCQELFFEEAFAFLKVRGVCTKRETSPTQLKVAPRFNASRRSRHRGPQLAGTRYITVVLTQPPAHGSLAASQSLNQGAGRSSPKLPPQSTWRCHQIDKALEPYREFSLIGI
ncbi:uncharacterized protein BJ171DRAFT_292033 [Polychytrium aggregatum]|uniref:uncharacterized protein n=1 Tax=Polychytrium aggregatum TaxID=110093 RepID=UPI0022FE2D3F|nr:uncharacterized protein BJ171DRAFT_292033 [Polychytrium aggregatum]KAI9207127.1 hypothetical protein BJ171DRAFT_292033 [Polychytrium aggregatum]